MNNIFFLVLLVILGLINHSEVYGAGECGISSPDKEARKLAPCISATMDANALVSDRCCNQIKKLGQKIACLCAIVLSNTAKIFGVKPEIAVTPSQNVAILLIVLWVTSVEITQCLEGGNNGCEGTCQNMWCGSLEECEL